MPQPSSTRNLLRRLILAIGAGAAIGLIISLVQRLLAPRLTQAPGSEQQPPTDALTLGHEAARADQKPALAGQEAVPAGQDAAPASQEAEVATRNPNSRKDSGPGGMSGGDGNQFAAFMSHAKADASMEARSTAALTLTQTLALTPALPYPRRLAGCRPN